MSYVLHYPLWFSVYHGHWYLVLWTYAQVGTVAFEAFLIGQFIHYGRKELMPDAAPGFFATLVILATLGVGALWWLVKIMLAALSAVGALASPFFLSPAYLTFFAVFMLWPLVNIALILRYPP